MHWRTRVSLVCIGLMASGPVVSFLAELKPWYRGIVPCLGVIWTGYLAYHFGRKDQRNIDADRDKEYFSITVPKAWNIDPENVWWFKFTFRFHAKGKEK